MAKAAVNPVRQLRELRQSVWLDELDDGLISTGRLSTQTAEDWVSGITSNRQSLKRRSAKIRATSARSRGTHLRNRARRRSTRI
jgi:hypothetical protein